MREVVAERSAVAMIFWREVRSEERGMGSGREAAMADGGREEVVDDRFRFLRLP